jgi:hypothetical protein
MVVKFRDRWKTRGLQQESRSIARQQLAGKPAQTQANQSPAGP